MVQFRRTIRRLYDRTSSFCRRLKNKTSLRLNPDQAYGTAPEANTSGCDAAGEHSDLHSTGGIATIVNVPHLPIEIIQIVLRHTAGFLSPYTHLRSELLEFENFPRPVSWFISLRLVDTAWDEMVVDIVAKVLIHNHFGWNTSARAALTRWSRLRYEDATGYRAGR